MTLTSDFIPLDQVNSSHVQSVGGKAASLGEMISAGVEVPPGWVATTELYREFLETTGLKPILRKFTDELKTAEPAQVHFIGNRLKQVISCQKWAPELRNRLLTIHADTRYAVRSSAVDEDSLDTSFAGQHSTFLNVRGRESILARVKDCFASLYEPRALAYRLKHGLDVLDCSIAVVIQELILPKYSGVMFTADPNTGAAKTVIEVVEGLGEALVSGVVTPTRWEVTFVKGGMDMERVQVGTQIRKLTTAPSGDSTRWVACTHPDGIPDYLVSQLAELGQTLVAHYNGVPQDIEFAVAGDDDIFILQSRPITTGSKKLSQALALPVIAKGGAASFGVGTGPVRRIHHTNELLTVQEGDVLVTEMTTPDYVSVFPKLAGLVTSLGGSTCHAAIVSREFNLPCVVGIGTLEGLSTGNVITVDGANGLVHKGAL